MIDTILDIRTRIIEKIQQGIDAGAMTYRMGYEWLITNLIDIHKLLQGDGVKIRQAGVYRYNRPFLTMSCFYFCKTGECVNRFSVLHGTEGHVLDEYNQPRFVIDNERAAWLYARHHLADSSVHKAWRDGRDPQPVTLENLSKHFGINCQMIEAYQADQDNISYAYKKTHKQDDKSNLILSIDEVRRLCERRTGKEPVLDSYIFHAKQEWGITEDQCRLCVLDIRTNQACLKKVISTTEDVIIPLSDLPGHYDLRYKLQVMTEGKWKDATPYRWLMPPKVQSVKSA